MASTRRFALIALALASLYVCVKLIRRRLGIQPKKTESPLRSVNFHFLRECNFACKYCFHVDKGKDKVGEGTILHKQQCETLLSLLRKGGCEKINFSGGEPFLKKELLGHMVRFCKETLGLKTGIISNGSLIHEEWLQKYGPHLDWLGISVDSFDEGTLMNIGRNQGKKKPAIMLKELLRIKAWCAQWHVHFKINTVVSRFNLTEDMHEPLQKLQPERWKVFQALTIKGENVNRNDAKECGSPRGSEGGTINAEEYASFISRHADCSPIVESNDIMQNSYVIVDEKGRFLDNSSGSKQARASIIDCGDAIRAFKGVAFDSASFAQRKGHEAIDIEDLE
jgi:radical S-adenosyl methionine domain-containing protein 2